MSCKKNWFYNLIVLMAGFLALYAFSVNFMHLSEGMSGSVLYRGNAVLLMFGTTAVVMIMAWIYNRFLRDKYLSADKKWMQILEKAVLAAILIAAVIIRVGVINSAEYALSESENRYFEIASHFNQGTLRTDGISYCDYIEEYPNTWGYALLLNCIFAIGGVSVKNGLYLNVIFSVAGILCLSAIARKLSGRAGALVVLLWSAFMPYEIQKVVTLSPQLATWFFLLACGAVAIHSLMDFGINKGKPGVCFAWNIVLGVLFAIGTVVNPLLILFAIAVLVVVMVQKFDLPGKPLNDLPLLLRAIRNGWIRCILIVLPFLLIYAILFSNVEMAINRDVSAIDYLVKIFTVEAGYEKGILTIISGMVQRFEQMWRITGIHGIINATTLFAGLLGFADMYRRKGNFLQIFVLLFVMMNVCTGMGLSDVQNTSSYIWVVCILMAGHGVQGVFEGAKDRQTEKFGENELQKVIEEAKAKELEAYKNVEEEVAKIREEALANVFDMNYALENGHVIMTVSEAYREDKAGSN